MRMFCFKSYAIWCSRKGNTPVTPKLTKYLENEWFLCWLCFFDYSRTFSRTDFKISVENISHSGALKLSLYIWLSYYDFRSFKYLLLINFSFYLYLIIIITISSSYEEFLFQCYFYMIRHWEKSFLHFLWQVAVGLTNVHLLGTEFLLF